MTQTDPTLAEMERLLAEAGLTYLQADYLSKDFEPEGWRIHDFPKDGQIAHCLAEGLDEDFAALIVAAVNNLPALLTALKSAEAEGWQDIATAPKDGSDVLASHVNPSCVMVVSWDEVPEHPDHPWLSDGDLRYHREAFTHWRPLPAPPALTKEASHGQS